MQLEETQKTYSRMKPPTCLKLQFDIRIHPVSFNLGEAEKNEDYHYRRFNKLAEYPSEHNYAKPLGPFLVRASSAIMRFF